MKTSQTILWTLTIAVMLVLNPISRAAETGTAFTYQGRLLDSNVAADGLYDMQFKLYDALAAGTQIGSTIVADDVDVADGYFIAELNFGSAAFLGQARWLDIAIRPGASANPADFVPLQPRQEITVAPYALYALSSGATRYGSGSAAVNLASRASAVVASIPFNYSFTAPPVVTITGKDNTGLTAGLIPSVANVTALGFDLVCANFSAVQIGGAYNFNWLAVGNGNLLNTFYKDADADGYSDGATSSQSPAPAGYYLPGQLAALTGDCDDTNAAVHPGAAQKSGMTASTRIVTTSTTSTGTGIPMLTSAIPNRRAVQRRIPATAMIIIPPFIRGQPNGVMGWIMTAIP